MLKILKSFLLLIIISQITYAQKLSTNYNDISTYDIDYLPDDKDAEAVILFDKGEIDFIENLKGNFDIRYVRTRRVKIINENGLKYAMVDIPLYIGSNGKKESIEKIEGFTYNLNKGVPSTVPLDVKTIYEEKIHKNYLVKKFTFPQVKVGTIVEYKVTIISPFLFQLPHWEFQDRIPTIYSEYFVKMIPFYGYVFSAPNILQFSQQVSKKESEDYRWAGITYNLMGHKYIMEDVPAFKDESYITSVDDYLMQLDFQLSKYYTLQGAEIQVVSTWAKFNKDLLKDDQFGGFISKSGNDGKKIIDELSIDSPSKEELAKRIINYVKKNFKWNQLKGKYARQKEKEFYKNRTGNSAELNLFLIGLLDEAEIEVSPVILSTRSNGKIHTDYPYTHYYNYVIPYITVNGKSFVTDATAIHLPFNYLPLRCFNDKAMLVNSKNPQWINIRSKVYSDEINKLSMEIDTDKSTINTVYSSITSNYASYIKKNTFENDSATISKDLNENGFQEIKRLKTRHYDSPNRKYTIIAQGENTLENIAGRIIVKPFLNFPLQENMLKQDKRTYPVDFLFLLNTKYETFINIPDGYNVEINTESKKVSNDILDMDFTTIKEKNRLKVTANYSFKKDVYPPSDYKRLKEFIDILIDNINQPLIFVPIEEQ
ncbi:DUF3857 domain-containing protein [Flammeovirga pectinis]|uniref:DUF3857 domain-containing protein n=1 Tax=Flammeovirga pectinis TaxID=2494373 RepID=A0A3Q9FN51_9BACT|nr:DUF3858 domain-containing protein [Flammeovirga pectinis]AZQ61479.1 DUF3857 domain-containing protein [Flammeovirga pectinis]